MSKLTPSKPDTQRPSRLPGIDALRILAALCVIYLHAKPFVSIDYANNSYSSVRDTIILFTRFAIPFFFIAAGYFLSIKLIASQRPLDIVKPYIWRLSVIYLVWTGLYFFFPINWFSLIVSGEWKPFYWEAAHAVIQLTSNPVTFLFKTTSMHLWFLPALAIAAFALALAVQFGKERLFILSGLCLYWVGMLSDAYSKTSWGLQIDHLLVLGFFYGPLFVGLGWVLAKGKRPSLSHAISLIVLGFTMQYLEAIWLLNTHGVPLISPGYLAGTVPFGLGMMMLGLALPPSSNGKLLGQLANLTLGIYLIHVWAKGLLLPLDNRLGGPLWELGFPILIFMVSWVFVAAIKRTPYRSRLL